MCQSPQATSAGWVALRKESVDRNNCTDNSTGKQLIVALRKESVDRNVHRVNAAMVAAVALRKESVDRNLSVNTGVQ